MKHLTLLSTSGRLLYKVPDILVNTAPLALVLTLVLLTFPAMTVAQARVLLGPPPTLQRSAAPASMETPPPQLPSPSPGPMSDPTLSLPFPQPVLPVVSPTHKKGRPLLPSPSAQLPQQVGHLTLSQAFALANQYNPQLVAIRKDIEQSQLDVKIAKIIPNPTATFAYGWGAITRAQGNPQQAMITQPIETNGKRKKRTLVAKAQLTYTSAQVNALSWDIRGQVRQAYSDLAAAEANVLALQDQMTLLNHLVDIASKRVQAGAAPVSEQLQAQLALSQMETQSYLARTRVQQSRLHLNSLMGYHLAPGFEILDKGLYTTNVPTKALQGKVIQLVPPADAPLPQVETLLQEAAEKRPDLKTALQQIQVNKAQVNQIKSLRIPDLSVSASYLFLQANSSAHPDGKKFYNGVMAAVSLPLPLYSNHGAEIAKAKSNLQQSQLQVLALRNQVQEEISSAWLALQSAQETIHKYQSQLLPASADVVQLAQKSYQYGKTGLSSVILAQQSERQIRQGYLDAVGAYQKAWTDLEKATGEPLER